MEATMFNTIVVGVDGREGGRDALTLAGRLALLNGGELIAVGSTHHTAAGRVFAGDDAAGTVHGSPCPVAVAPRGLAGQDWPHVSRIGVGYDAGPEATQALAFAARLARDCDAAIVVRSVVVRPQAEANLSAYDADWLERARDVAHTQLTQALYELDVEATGDLAVGLAAEELVELSKDVDLLVLGSRCWGPVRRAMAGSTAAAVMRKAHAPVIVLPRGAATGQPGEGEIETAEPATTI